MPAFSPAAPCAPFAILLLWTSLTQAQVSLPIRNEASAIAEDRVEAALTQQVSFTFSDLPFKDAIQAIQRKTGLPIVLATKKVEEASISLETPVTVSLSDLTLEAFLRNFLSDLGLAFIVKDEVLQITTPEDSGSQLDSRIYPVLDLVARRTPVDESSAVVTSRTAGGRMGIADYESLMDVITTTIDPDSWEDVGGPGTIVEFDNAGVLIISQTRDVHRKIGPLLNTLRHVKGQQGLPTIAPSARVSTQVRSPDGRLNAKGGLFSAESATPLTRRRVVAPQHSWQVPQVYEE
jgi:hypothetical protein